MSDEDHFLFIDSRFSESASNVDFSVIFNKSVDSHSGGYPTQVFKNVKKVELTALSFNHGIFIAFPDENYVVLDIEELNNRLHSNVPEVNQSFAFVYVDSNEQIEKSLKGHDFDDKIKYFNPPLSSLSRLTIKLKNPITRDIVSDLGKTTFMFKITTGPSSA